MPQGLHNWSRTAATNATADSSINWAEGQAPSSVNDSARALMARVAEWRDDLGGIATGGTSTAYTITSYRNFTTAALMDKAIITIIPHTTSGADPTLAVDGLTARQIRTATGVNVPTGALVSGTPYALVYIHSSTEFILLGFDANPYNIPLGGLIDYAGATAPHTSYALAYGQAISRTTYATLFTLISTTFGVGDGSTTFNIPDCRGRVIAGKDDMGGASANRLTDQSGGLNGDTLGATGGAETHALVTGELASHTHTGTTASNGAHTHDLSAQVYASGSTAPAAGAGGAVLSTITALSNGAHTHTITTDASGSGTAHNNVQPTIVLNKLIRII